MPRQPRQKQRRLWLALCLAVALGALVGWAWHTATQPTPFLVSSSSPPTQELLTASPRPAASADRRIPSPPTVDPTRLLAHVKALAFVRRTEAERSRARAYLSQALTSLGWSPTSQPFDSGLNLLAQRPGTDPEAGTILVAAHYDTVPGSPGADDNASGVAVILEIARLLHSRATPRTLQIAFFDREEAGLLGSLAFAADPARLVNLHGAIILDMVSFACHTAGCQRYPAGLPVASLRDRGDFLAAIGDLEHAPLLEAFQQPDQRDLPTVLTLPIPLKGLSTPDLLRSDHAPFWLKGVGAVLVTDTANFRSPHYHQPSDTFETLDPDFFAGAAQRVVNATAALLESTAPTRSRQSSATRSVEAPG